MRAMILLCILTQLQIRKCLSLLPEIATMQHYWMLPARIDASVHDVHGKNNTLNVQGIAKGMYELKIFSDTSIDTEKIVVQ